MNFTRISGLLLRQWYLFKDNPTRVFQIFAWILLEMISYGFLSNYVTGLTAVNFTLIFLGCILVWEFLIRVMNGVTVAFFEDVWSRNFLNIFASPLTLSEYLTGLVITSIATSTLGLIAMLILAGLGFGLNIGFFGLALIPFFLVLFLMGIALGILGVAIVLRFGPSSEWFIWPIPAILSPFCGVLYPLTVLPHWMQFVGKILPPSYVFENMRTIASGGAFDGRAFLISLVLVLLYLALAYTLFRVIFRRAVRTGLLARYSAENVS